MISLDTTPGLEGGGMKENGWRSEFTYDIFDTL
jgi:hypothetical protein